MIGRFRNRRRPRLLPAWLEEALAIGALILVAVLAALHFGVAP